MDFLKRTKRPSFLVATTITHIITSADLIDLREQAMLLQLTAAMKEFGNADDILKQPLPVAYTRSVNQPGLACLLALLEGSCTRWACLASHAPDDAHPNIFKSMGSHQAS